MRLVEEVDWGKEGALAGDRQLSSSFRWTVSNTCTGSGGPRAEGWSLASKSRSSGVGTVGPTPNSRSKSPPAAKPASITRFTPSRFSPNRAGSRRPMYFAAWRDEQAGQAHKNGGQMLRMVDYWVGRGGDMGKLGQ